MLMTASTMIPMATASPDPTMTGGAASFTIDYSYIARDPMDRITTN